MRPFLFVSLALLTSCIPQASYPKLPDVNRTMSSAVVLVHHYDEYDNALPDVEDSMFQEHQAYCSGQWISRTHVLTAAHCVQRTITQVLEIPGWGTIEQEVPSDESPIGDLKKVSTFSDFKRNRDLRTYTVFAVVRYDREKDLALLETRGAPATEWMRLSRSDVEVGDHVFALGAPSGIAFTLTDGIVSRVGVSFPGEDVRLTQASANIYFGNSGGCLLNDRGELVGVASAMASRQSHLGFWISLPEVRGFVSGP